MFDNSLGVTILHIMEGVKARIELRLNPYSLTSWRRLRVGMNGNNHRSTLEHQKFANEINEVFFSLILTFVSC